MTVLVTGPRGHVGRNVLRQLLAIGHPVRALLFDDQKADHIADRVEVVHGDLARPESLRPALDGVHTVFLYGNAEGIEGFIAESIDAGVTRVVALSSASVAAANADVNPIARRHRAVEEALTGSPLETTFLRPAAFATNALQWASSIRTEDTACAPYPNSYVVPIHEADVAAVAVEAMTHSGHDGATYFLTGPEAMTQRTQVQLIADAIGRPLRFKEQTPDEAREVMARTVPPEVADTVLGYFAATEGRPGKISNTVSQVTGRSARTFAQWVREHLSEFS